MAFEFAVMISKDEQLYEVEWRDVLENTWQA